MLNRETQDDEQRGFISKKEITLKDNTKEIPFFFKALMVLTVYSIQGMATDFFVYSVSTELVINGANNQQLALLSLVSFPWCMKIFWAPLQDAFYIKFLGRRKTWIICSSILLALLWSYLSAEADRLFENVNVGQLTIIGLITTFLLAVQDISMDGWIVKLAKNDAELGRFSFCSSFGWTLGGLISFQIYLWLSSNEWCQYLFHRDKLLDTQMLVNFIGLSFILMSIGVYLTPEVKDSVELDDQQDEFEDKSSNVERFSDIIHKLKQLKKQPQLLKLIFVFFISEIGFQYFESLSPVVFLDKGMDPNVYAFIGCISIGLECIAGLIVSSYQQKEMTIFMMSFILRTLNSIFYFIIISMLNMGLIDFPMALILYGIQFNIAQIAYAMVSIPVLNFFLRICEEKVEGTYLALLTSTFFSAAIWSSTLAFLVTDLVGHTATMLISLAFDLGFILAFGKQIIGWEKLPEEYWALGK